MAKKFFETKVTRAVRLPALNTLTPERPFPFLGFLQEWVQPARGLRRTEYLPHLFELDRAIASLVERVEKKVGISFPPLPTVGEEPKRPSFAGDEKQDEVERVTREYAEALKAFRMKLDEEKKAYEARVVEYQKALAKGSIGERFYLTEAAFKAALESVKAALDKAGTPRQLPDGTTVVGLDPKWETRILRHFHHFAESHAVEEKEIPAGLLPGAEDDDDAYVDEDEDAASSGAPAAEPAN